MWRDKYRLKGIVPGKVVTKKYGEVDFSRDDLSEELCEKLVNDKFQYLEKIPVAVKAAKNEKAPE